MVRQIKKSKIRRREKTKVAEISFTERLFLFFQKNAKVMMYVALGVLVVAVATGIFLFSRYQNEKNAGERFYGVLNSYMKNEEEQKTDNVRYAKASSDFQKIINDYSGTKYAEWSLVYMGNINLRLKNYAKAIENYEQYLKKNKEVDFFTVSAYRGKGIVYIEEGKYAEAVKVYKDFMKLGNVPLIDKSLWDIGWCYERIGDMKNALEFYKRILNEHPDSLLKRDAEMKVKVLEQTKQQSL